MFDPSDIKTVAATLADKELAAEIDADFLSIACPTPYRIVLTTNYVGYTGGLRVIEDIYNTALATYK